jgi:hypothetical protein
VGCLCACAAGSDDDLVEDWSFNAWCGPDLCDWTTEQAGIERAYSWHRKDAAVSFVDKDARISQLLPRAAERCFLFDTIADLDPRANLTLLLDFNADGTADLYHQLAAVSWTRVPIVIPTPAAYENVRFILQKEGIGRAVLAQLRVVSTDDCDPTPLKLKDGSRCTLDEVCGSGRCAGGTCSSLPTPQGAR